MLQTNNTLPGAMRLSDLMFQPADLVIEYLKDKPDSFGEAIAKMCYQHITNNADHLYS